MLSDFRYFEAPTYWRPAPGDPPAVFLAGGITGCPRWHDDAIDLLHATGVDMVVLNPNREHFPIHDPAAGREQVWWEQDHLLLPQTITMMWYPASDRTVTTQPIAQFEYGQILNPATLASGRRFVVGADPGYPRQRDVELMMAYHRPDEPVYATLSALVTATAELVRAEAVRPPVEVGIEYLFYAAAHGVHPSEVEEGDAGLDAVRQLVRFFSEQGAAAFSDAVGLPEGTSMEEVADWLASRESGSRREEPPSPTHLDGEQQ